MLTIDSNYADAFMQAYARSEVSGADC